MSAGFYGGGGGRIANATVLVTPNLTSFQAQLQAAINKAFAGVQIPAVGAAGGKAAAGIKETTRTANLLRGALIGVSRVTPVTVFGLGAAGTAGIGVALALRTAVHDAALFEKQLNTLQAITKISDDRLNEVRQTAIALGGDVNLAAISATDAAQALTELSKAGLSIKDSMDAARGVLELAGAAEISAGEAARFVATELNAFKLAGTDAQEVVDLLASASIAAQGEITDFANAFQQASAVAAQAGLTVKQTTAAFTLLAKAGITSSDAGTSLRTFLLRLIPTTKQAGQFVKALGVELDESKTVGQQLSDVIAQYRTALLALSPVQQVATLNQIFGQDAVRAATILLNDQRGAFDRQIEALGQSGVAAELNVAKAEGLSGAYAGLKSQLETLGTQFGLLVDGPLESVLRGFSDVIRKSERVIGKIDDLAKAIGNLKDVEIAVDFVVSITDAIPGPVKTALKEAAKFGLPGIGPFLVALDAVDALTGGAGPNRGPGVDLFGKKGNALRNQFSFDPTQGLDAEFDRTFGVAADAAAKQDKARRAAIAKLLKEQGGGADGDKDKIDFDITPSIGLQINQLQAELSHSLQKELAADKLVRDYFEKRLATAKEGSARYLKILGAFQQADAAVQSVQGQIDQQREAAAKELADRLKEQREAAVKLAKSIIDLQNETLDTRLSAAQLTKPIDDNIRIYNLQIAAARADIARQRKLAAAAKKGSQARIDAALQIQEDLQRINAIKASIKSLKDGDKDSGFSLNDLFKEAVTQFNEFGSNVSQSPGTPGSARGALAGGILAQKPGITKADELKLREAATTNDLLAQILAAIDGAGLNGNPYPFTPNQASKQHPGGTSFEKARSLGRTVRAF